MEPRDYIDKEKGFLKKNYIYRDEDGNITVKNLGVMKKIINKII